LTKELTAEGMAIHYQDLSDGIGAFLEPGNDNWSYIPLFRPIWRKYIFKEQGFTMKKRAEVLGFICRYSFRHPVHCRDAWENKRFQPARPIILKRPKLDLHGIMGGISRKTTAILLLSITSKWKIVAEADEFDRSFYSYPDLAVITQWMPIIWTSGDPSIRLWKHLNDFAAGSNREERSL
jgi:UDP-N-acetylmuramate--alanine ligase